MCVKLSAKAWDLDMPSSEKFVLLYLCEKANARKGDIAWPSISTISKRTGLSERTVQGAIKTLCENGNLDRRQVTGKGTIYTVHPRSHCTGAATAPPQNLHLTPAATAPKPLKEPLEERTKAKALDASAPIDPLKMMFDSGVAYLTNNGITPAKARTLLGKWKADSSAGAVIEAIAKAQREGTPDPVAFIFGCIKARANGANYDFGEGPGQAWRDPYSRKIWTRDSQGLLPPEATAPML